MRYIDLKYRLDKGLALLLLIITSPLLLITAVAIKLTSPGPIIFKQERLGLHGKAFTMYKFRSMYVGAEKKDVYDRKGDTRVTPVGRFIRKTSIDELPQLINILKGEMSFIGPRPALTYHPWPYEKYTGKQRRMFSVRPGITGWAQVNGRKEVEWPRRIAMNVEYVNKISFLFDLKIFAKTILKVFMMEGNLNTKETVKKE